MATHTNLTSLFTAIADAIRAKTGSAEPIVVDNFPTEIENSPTGGGMAHITGDNIADYFSVTNGSYYFAESGGVFRSNNGGKASSTATTTLTALADMDVFLVYTYSSEASYDKFTLKIGGTTVENAVSGATTQKIYSGTIAKGDTMIFTYAKDSSKDANDDKCTFILTVT